MPADVPVEGGRARVLSGEILADNGDGTFLVDIDGDAVGVTVAWAPVVRVGEIGTVLDIDGAQVLIGPRASDSVPSDILRGMGSFEVWGEYTGATSGVAPVGWSLFWGVETVRMVNPDTAWTADGSLACALGVPAAQSHQGVITNLAILLEDTRSILRVRGSWKPQANLSGHILTARVYWGRTDAEAQPFGGGLATDVQFITLGTSTARIDFDASVQQPTGYVYMRVFLDHAQRTTAPFTAGWVSVDGVSVEVIPAGGGALTLVATGSVSVPTPTPNTPGSAVVTWPVGRFPGAPYVQVSAISADPGGAFTQVSFSNNSATSVTVWCRRASGTATTVHWLGTYVIEPSIVTFRVPRRRIGYPPPLPVGTGPLP